MDKKNFLNILSPDIAIERINTFGKLGESFLFIIDYKAENIIVIPVNEIDSSEILFQFEKINNMPKHFNYPEAKPFILEKFPIKKEDYLAKIYYVQSEIHRGNTFLTNLTQPTPVSTNYSLQEIFFHSEAKFKLWLKDRFVVFSPEIFVKIEDGKISSFPMKGTIDANLPDAENLILNDKKEIAEHATIVDLLRNDLSQVADNVEVVRYRYVEKIKTNQTDLLQVSSQIEGVLPDNYKEKLGEIIFKLLPAGSISGAPKPKTLEIIEKAEGYERGFYTGICGFFDGKNMVSSVMIRFIEQTNSGFVFKSGGGITFLSNPENEYEELIQKIYAPIY